MRVRKLIIKYLQKARIMQLATSLNNKPWVCNIHFCADEKLNIYWISTPQRRHSIDVQKNPNVAVTIMVHEDTPDEKYIICVSVEGSARLMSEKEVKGIGKSYIEKLGKDPQLLTDIQEGRNPHKFYRLTPTRLVLFDTKNFPDNPRQEISL